MVNPMKVLCEVCVSPSKNMDGKISALPSPAYECDNIAEHDDKSETKESLSASSSPSPLKSRNNNHDGAEARAEFKWNLEEMRLRHYIANIIHTINTKQETSVLQLQYLHLRLNFLREELKRLQQTETPKKTETITQVQPSALMTDIYQDDSDNINNIVINKTRKRSASLISLNSSQHTGIVSNNTSTMNTLFSTSSKRVPSLPSLQLQHLLPPPLPSPALPLPELGQASQIKTTNYDTSLQHFSSLLASSRQTPMKRNSSSPLLLSLPQSQTQIQTQTKTKPTNKNKVKAQTKTQTQNKTQRWKKRNYKGKISKTDLRVSRLPAVPRCKKHANCPNQCGYVTRDTGFQQRLRDDYCHFVLENDHKAGNEYLANFLYPNQGRFLESVKEGRKEIPNSTVGCVWCQTCPESCFSEKKHNFSRMTCPNWQKAQDFYLSYANLKTFHYTVPTIDGTTREKDGVFIDVCVSTFQAIYGLSSDRLTTIRRTRVDLAKKSCSGEEDNLTETNHQKKNSGVVNSTSTAS